MLKTNYKVLELKDYRAYLEDLKNRVPISNTKEQEIYDFIEDSYNSIESDELALYKSFNRILHSTSFNMEEKMYSSMMLLLCDLKTQKVRKDTEEKNRSFKSKFEDDDEYSGEDDDEENE